MSNWVVGITGGIGSGKSLVAELFGKLGIAVIDADQAARWVVAKDSPALVTIIEHFGPHLLLADGHLDRRALRQIIFDNTADRLWLEKLLHPLIRKQICDFLQRAQSPYAMLVSPLLLETNQHQLTQRILVIDSPEKLQIERSIQRDNSSEQQIRAIMQTQLSRAERLSRADDVIINDKHIEHLEQQVKLLHQHYLTLCKSE